MNRDALIRITVKVVVACLCLVFPTTSQERQQTKISNYERDEVLDMLNSISSDVKKHYYDPTFHGIDWNANIKIYEEKIRSAASLNHGLSEVAAALDALNDSHTFFLPPPRPYTHDFGWRPAMIGQKCYVLGVRPQTDAEKKGVKPGDQVLSINGYVPARNNLWKMNFLFNVLRPQPALHLSLLSPSGERKNVEIEAEMKQLPAQKDMTLNSLFQNIREFEKLANERRMRWVETPDGIMILKFPSFAFTEAEVDTAIKRARKNKTLIMDLRGNDGGSIETLQAFLSNFFDHEVKIADRRMRDNSKTEMTKSRGKGMFTGKLVVLIDSRSASASEVLARVVQLEKRGTVLGDRSAGMVMEAKHYTYQIGSGIVLVYGASITDADLIMADGQSLERDGVTPDELILPSAEDIAAGYDPVLARAVALADGQMTPEAAGKLFPYEWHKD
jgi:C-terminal processing protease CtpA/Prc